MKIFQRSDAMLETRRLPELYREQTEFNLLDQIQSSIGSSDFERLLSLRFERISK